MKRSLKTKMTARVMRESSYTITQTPTGWKVRGTGEKAQRQFSLRRVETGQWDLSAGSLTASGRARSRLTATTVEEAVALAEAALYPVRPRLENPSTLRIAEALVRAIESM